MEGECGEGAGRAEPHVAVGTPIDGRPEPVGELPPHDAVESVGRDHEVGSQQGADIRDLRAALEAHPDRFDATDQSREQRPPRQTPEAVTGRGHDGAVNVYVDVVTIAELYRHHVISR